jgi:hypothetical protein
MKLANRDIDLILEALPHLLSGGQSLTDRPELFSLSERLKKARSRSAPRATPSPKSHKLVWRIPEDNPKLVQAIKDALTDFGPE